MRRVLINIWGPISIQSFGLFIVIGIIITTWLIIKHPRCSKIISEENFKKAVITAIISGLIGGRILYIFEIPTYSFINILKIWEGGLSSLGVIIGIIVTLPIYLRSIKVPIIQFLDLLAIYAPLMASITRIGCFLAGCCHGVETTSPLSITYTDPESIAPLGKALHPTQLYSSATLFLIFLLMRYKFLHILRKPGQITCIYLILISIERFSIEFLRADRVFFSKKSFFTFFSIDQTIALLAGTLALTTLIGIQIFGKKHKI